MQEIRTKRLVLREAHLKQNIWFRRDENGAPVWKDTLVYAILENETAGKRFV